MTREIKLHKDVDASEWAVYKDKAARDVIFSTMAYLNISSDEEKAKFEELSAQVPDAFQMIFFTDHLDDTKKNDFRSAVFLNHETKEIIVACSGTRFGMHREGISDMISDAFLSLEENPPKLESMKQTNQMILDSLGDEAGEYKIHYTGHSLGAFMADVGAADMAIKIREAGITKTDGTRSDISSMTFENPGSRVLIEKMYEDHDLDPADYSKDVDYRGMNNRRNFINQGGAHAGKMWEVIPDTMEDLSLLQVFAIHVSHMLERFAPVCARIFETWAFGSVEKQLNAHNLTHFRDVLCEEASSSEKETGATVRKADLVDRKAFHASGIITKCKSMLYDLGLFKKIDEMRVDNGRIGKAEFVAVSPERIKTVSKVELETAIKKTAIGKATLVENPTSLPTAYEVLSNSKSRTR